MDNFSHSQFAHCESGAVSSILTHYGLNISEPMAFGITNSLTFFYFPLLKVNNMPLIAYREVPKNIVNNISKVLGVEIQKKKFNNPIEANNELTRLVKDEGKIVGLQTSVFYLPYMPKDMRFHFNAHNLVVFGKEEDEYLISDPVFEESVRCNEKDLSVARFAKGVFAPKGFLYYPTSIPKNIDFKSVITKAIRKNSRRMLAPFPLLGYRGMNTLANSITKLQTKDERYLKNFLTHIVRMQEEIGTGGGGFRFLYSAFLQEAKEYGLDKEKLENASKLVVESGDCLREFALKCVQSCKNLDKFNSKELVFSLREAAKIEKEVFTKLKKI